MADEQLTEYTMQTPDGRTVTLAAPSPQAAIAGMKSQLAREKFQKEQIRTDPQEAPPQFDMALKQGFSSQKEQDEFVATNPAFTHARAAAKGINVRSGIDPVIRGKAALLNFNPERQALAVQELIKMSLPPGAVPPGVPIVGQIEGVNVALQPQEDGGFRYNAIDPLGIDVGDFAALGAELPQLVPEVIAGVGGAIAGAPGGPVSSFAASTGAATVASVLGLDARTWLAKQLGVPEDIVDGALTDETRYITALMTFGGDVVTAGILGTARQLGSVLGRPLNAEDMARVYPEVMQSMRTKADFEETFNQPLPLNIAQSSGDADMATATRTMQSQSTGKDSISLTADSVKSDNAAANALRTLTNQNVRTPQDSLRGLEAVTSDVQAGVRGAREAAEREADVAEENLDTWMNTMDSQRNSNTFIAVRESARQEADTARQANTDAWDNYRKEVGWKQGEGSRILFDNSSNSRIRTALFEMDEQAQGAMLNSSRKSQEAFVKDAGMDTTVGAKAADFQGLAADTLDPRQLHFTLSELKRKLRHAEKGIDPDGFRVEDLRRMTQAIDETIKEGPMIGRTGDAVTPEKVSRVRQSFTDANDLTVATHSLYDSANMRSLLEMKTRVDPISGEVTRSMDMPAGLIETKMFAPNDARFLSDSIDATGSNPRIISNLTDELSRKHRNATAGDATGNANRQFIDEHADHMRILGIDPAAIRGSGSLAQAARVQRQTADRVTKRLQTTFGKQLGGDDATDVTNIAAELRNIGFKKAKNVLTFLDREAPALAAEVRDHSLLDIERTLSTAGGTRIDFNGLRKMVEGQADSLRAIHGTQYVNNLQLILNAEALVKRGTLGRSAPGANAQSTLMNITRSVLGPLSKKQRFITAVQRGSKRARASSVTDLLSDPSRIAEFIEMRALNGAELGAALTAFDVALSPVDASLGETDANSRAALQQQGQNPLIPGPNDPAPSRDRRASDPQAQRPELMPALRQDLKRHEGFGKDGKPGEIYTDKTGNRTIGWGRNLEAHPITDAEYKAMNTTKEEVADNGINETQAEVLFRNDVYRARTDAGKLPGYVHMNPVQKDALSNMVFNMGVTNIRAKFPNMLKALAARQWDVAANEMLVNAKGTGPSTYRKVNGQRVEELANMIRTGKRS